MSLFLVAPKNIQENRVVMDEGESHHLLHVLRKKIGDRITLTYGQGELFEAKILQTEPDAVLEILSSQKSSEDQTLSLILAPALLKGPRMDWLMEKATELGVSQILPLLTERGVVKAKSLSEKSQKIRRWQRISQAALKQSERTLLPQIGPILSFSELLENSQKRQATKILFTIPNKNLNTLKKLEEILRTSHNERLFIVAIGPEGGWTTKELHMAEKAGFQFSSLGDHALRAETAALAAVTLLHYLKTSTFS